MPNGVNKGLSGYNRLLWDVSAGVGNFAISHNISLAFPGVARFAAIWSVTPIINCVGFQTLWLPVDSQ